MSVSSFSSFNSSAAPSLGAGGVTEPPLYTQYRPVARDLVPLPKAVIYLLMAGMVVVGVAYAIVGHLIKDLAIDITECVLGPTGDEEKEAVDNLRGGVRANQPPPVHPFTHNAFHVWDQDDMVIHLPPDESPQLSPLLLAAMPYMPSFFPHQHSPSYDNSPSGSPWASGEVSLARDL